MTSQAEDTGFVKRSVIAKLRNENLHKAKTDCVFGVSVLAGLVMGRCLFTGLTTQRRINSESKSSKGQILAE
jgi:hypothetical protein